VATELTASAQIRFLVIGRGGEKSTLLVGGVNAVFDQQEYAAGTVTNRGIRLALAGATLALFT
jgi:hypothetical protein